MVFSNCTGWITIGIGCFTRLALTGCFVGSPIVEDYCGMVDGKLVPVMTTSFLRLKGSATD